MEIIEKEKNEEDCSGDYWAVDDPTNSLCPEHQPSLGWSEFTKTVIPGSGTESRGWDGIYFGWPCHLSPVNPTDPTVFWDARKAGTSQWEIEFEYKRINTTGTIENVKFFETIQLGQNIVTDPNNPSFTTIKGNAALNANILDPDFCPVSSTPCY